MPSKLLNVLFLIVTVFLDGAILFSLSTPWMRLLLGMLLLVPIVLISSHLGLAEWFASLVATKGRPRRFPVLRTKVVALLEEIKRLNWLVVDLDRGIRSPETVTADIKMCEQRMEGLLSEIRRTAGQSTVESPAEGEN